MGKGKKKNYSMLHAHSGIKNNCQQLIVVWHFFSLLVSFLNCYFLLNVLKECTQKNTETFYKTFWHIYLKIHISVIHTSHEYFYSRLMKSNVDTWWQSYYIFFINYSVLVKLKLFTHSHIRFVFFFQLIDLVVSLRNWWCSFSNNTCKWAKH